MSQDTNYRTERNFLQDRGKCRRISSQHSFLHGIFEAEKELANGITAQLPLEFSFTYNDKQCIDPTLSQQFPECPIKKGDSLSSLSLTNPWFDSKTMSESLLTVPLSQILDTKAADKVHSHNLRSKQRSEDSEELKRGDTVETESVPRKKRAYFRKNKHPREVIAKVEAERLKRKRAKNRELAAKSRQKRKARMAFLEREYDRLLVENKALKSEVSILKRQK